MVRAQSLWLEPNADMLSCSYLSLVDKIRLSFGCSWWVKPSQDHKQTCGNIALREVALGCDVSSQNVMFGLFIYEMNSYVNFTRLLQLLVIIISHVSFTTECLVRLF